MTHARRMLTPWLLAVVIALTAGGVADAVPRHALAVTSIAVTTFTDELNTDGDCSLREAIRAANTDAAVDACPAGSGADTIVLDAGTYQLTITGDEDAGSTGDLDILASLTIVGQGINVSIVEGIGGTPERIFEVMRGATVRMESFTVRYGGTGIKNRGTLTLDSMWVVSSKGAGISNLASVWGQQVRLYVNDSVIGSHQYYGIYLLAETCCAGSTARVEATITNSVLSYNEQHAVYAYHSHGFAHATIVNTTITGTRNGAGVYARGGATGHASAEIISSTIVDNRWGILSGSYSDGGTDSMTIRNSILSNNRSGPSPTNCDSLPTDHLVTSLGNNVVSDATCPTVFVAAGDQTSTDPLLGPLADHGGPTRTHPLLDGSPAIDAVPASACVDPNDAALISDQRGEPRPNGPACDAGAFELQITIPPLVLAISEGIGVRDTAAVVPPLVISVGEVVGVGDTATVVPPLVLSVAEAVGVTDSTAVVPPLVLSVAEVVDVTDSTAVVPPLVISLGEAVGVRDLTIAEARFPDADGDGIQDVLDGHMETVGGVPTFISDAHVFSDAFDDSQTGGTTRGVIVDRAGLAIVISDLTGALGVRLEAGGAPGFANIDVCGGSAVVHPASGTTTTATCGSVTLEVITGPVTADLIGDDGHEAAVTLADGQSMTFHPESMTVTTPPGQGDITLLVAGEEVVVPGGTTVVAIKLLPTTTTVTFGPGPFVYTGTAFTATATVTPIEAATVTPSGTATIAYTGDCTNPGTTCTATATYAGDTYYAESTATASITITYLICPARGDDDGHDDDGQHGDDGRGKESGSTIPVKIRVCDANGHSVGSRSLDVTAVGLSPTGDLSASGKSNRGNLFRFDGGTYRFNLSTKGLEAGDYTLDYTVGSDPTLYHYAFTVRERGKPDKGDKADKPDKGDKADKPEKGDKADRPDKSDEDDGADDEHEDDADGEH